MAKSVTVARAMTYSAVVSVLTFVAGVGLITLAVSGQREATCELVRAQINAYAETPPEPNTRAADLAAAWIRFGHRQHCIK